MRSEAWALGWSAYQSGYLADLLRVGAVAYTSQRLNGPEDRDGTLLLQARAGVRTPCWARSTARSNSPTSCTVRIGRKEYNTPYLNGNDSRMSPNTFQGAIVYGKAGGVRTASEWRVRRRLYRQDQAAQRRRFRVDVDRGRRQACTAACTVGGAQLREPGILSMGAIQLPVRRHHQYFLQGNQGSRCRCGGAPRTAARPAQF